MRLSRIHFSRHLRALSAISSLVVFLTLLGCSTTSQPAPHAGPSLFARYESGGAARYGLVEGDRIRAIEGDIFGQWSAASSTRPLQSVRLLAPTAPRTVVALAGNYRSHLGERAKPTEPQGFFKPVTTIIPQGEPIVIPPGTADVHYEAEMVIVIGKRAKNVSRTSALDYVFGVTCGNDVSARDWQKNDIQWWRAKGCDTFGPCGPYIATGLDYDNLQLSLRLNGEVRQSQSTKELIFGVADVVSFISRHVTLEPGDLIFTGTPGETSAIQPGDVVEVDLEGVGVLRNPVRAAK